MRKLKKHDNDDIETTILHQALAMQEVAQMSRYFGDGLHLGKVVISLEE